MNKKPLLLAIILITLLTSSITYATLSPLTPPPVGGYDSGSNSILDPGCAPNAVDCVVNLPSGGSVTADNGLTATGSNVQLGGTLVRNTNIDQAGFDLNIQNGAYRLFSGIDPLGFGSTDPGMIMYQDGSLTNGLSQVIGMSNENQNPFVAIGNVDWQNSAPCTDVQIGGYSVYERSYIYSVIGDTDGCIYSTRRINSGAHQFQESSYNNTTGEYFGYDMNDNFFSVIYENNSHEESNFTILKSGQTGIAIDNFEANTNGNIFQVGNGSTGIIGYVDNGTGNWVAVSDARQKHNISDITYGLDAINKLHPVSFEYNRNNEHTIGFLAQEVKDIVPEAVFGTEEKGYGMSYSTLTPALVKAIQELNLKVDLLSMNAGNTSTDIFGSLKSWLADTGNGITEIIAGTFRAKEQLCINTTCISESELQEFKNWKNQNTAPVPPVPVIEVVPSPEPTDTPIGENAIDNPVVDTTDTTVSTGGIQ